MKHCSTEVRTTIFGSHQLYTSDDALMRPFGNCTTCSRNTGALYGLAVILTLNLLTWTIWRAPTNASKWRMRFNSAFKGLKILLITCGLYPEYTKISREVYILLIFLWSHPDFCSMETGIISRK
jgi:hypothetical protein